MNVLSSLTERKKPFKQGPYLYLAEDCPPISLAAVFLISGALSHCAKCPINNLSIQKIASCQIGITYSPNASVKSDTSFFLRENRLIPVICIRY